MADEKVISALIRFGVDKQSVEAVRRGTKGVEDALTEAAAKAEKVKVNTERMDAALRKLDTIGSGVRRLGMGLNQLGEFFNNDQLRKVGQMTAGIGDLTESVRGLYDLGKTLNGMGGLGKMIGGAGAVAGGAVLGAGIYDATIGKARGDSAGSIMAQSAAVFNRNLTLQLTGNAEQANRAFTDTARLYGLIKSEAAEYNDTLTKQKQIYGSVAGVLLALEKQLTASAQAAQQRGNLLGIGTITSAMSGVVGVMATASAQNDPAIKAYAAYQQSNVEAEKKYGAERSKIVGQALIDQVRAVQKFQTDEKALRTQFDQANLTSLRAFAESEIKIKSDAARQNAQIAAQFAQNEQRTLEEYQRSRQKSLADYERSRQQALADHQRSEQRTIDDYQRNRVKSLAAFAQSEAETEAQYYAQRVKDAEKYGVAVQRAEEDHRLQMLRMAEDANAQISDLADARDAFGLIRAQREQEVQRRRAEEDYQLQVARKNTDYAAALAEQEAAFVEQRASRLQNLEAQLADQDVEFQRQAEQRQADWDRTRQEQQADFDRNRQEQQADFDRAAAQRQSDFEAQAQERAAEAQRQAGERLAEYNAQKQERASQYLLDAQARAETFQAELGRIQSERNTRLTELDGQFSDEKTKREQAFKDQLDALGVNLGDETTARRNHQRDMAVEYQSWLDGMLGATTANVTAMNASLATITVSAEAVKQVAQQIMSGASSSITGGLQWLFGSSGSAGSSLPGVGGVPYVPGLNGYAAGGYAAGPINAGERGYEFVLSHDTTRAAEEVAGGRLSQASLLGALGGAGRGLSVAQNFTFIGSQSESEKQWYKQVAYDQALSAFNDVLEQRA